MKRFFILLAAFACVTCVWAADLLYLNTSAGSARLMEAGWRQQYFAIQPYLETQQNLAFCGPASIAAVMNSLDLPRPVAMNLGPYRYFTQDNVFNSVTESVKRREQVLGRGMTLADVVAFLKALGVDASAHPADRLSADRFRALLKESLADPDRRLIANYDRKALGQQGGGHLSPLGAYDAVSDSVLVLDVAKFKYPPTWVGLSDLLAAMNTRDPDSGRPRGLIVVTRRAAP
ncbi:MAG: phytochelatin synthase family protein [Proteobacteria bacterium]|nr:phytochelatin synthase family protein [Pseudomonadota bacterium]HQR03473.1 phytochelatin synthase family protein [Rhodocyclaceae bacterium]